MQSGGTEGSRRGRGTPKPWALGRRCDQGPEVPSVTPPPGRGGGAVIWGSGPAGLRTPAGSPDKAPRP